MRLFITFEGIDGSGKSTQLHALYEWLRRKGHDVIHTREPGGTEIGERIRPLLVGQGSRNMLPSTRALLFSAARSQVVAEVIRPHLERGGIVLCDRYIHSTIAYQGYGEGMDRSELDSIINIATKGLMPDLTIYLDVPVLNGLWRGIRRRGNNWRSRLPWLIEKDDGRKVLDYFDFHRRVARGYREMAREDPGRWLVVNATRPVRVIEAEIRAGVEARLS